MFELKDKDVAVWTNNNGRTFPSAIDVTCPHCSRMVTFSTDKWISASAGCFMANLTCPACPGRVRFLMVDHMGDGHSLKDEETLWMLAASNQKAPIEAIYTIDEFEGSLLRAYESIINVYNTGEWTATAVLARRLLEGITLEVLGENCKNDSLSKRLSKLPESRDLSKPISSLSDAIRKGGNLGAHFDLEKEPDQTVATLMVELIEDLIEYLFVLPKRIDELHNKIENLGHNSNKDS